MKLVRGGGWHTEALFTCDLFKCRIIELVQLTENLN